MHPLIVDLDRFRNLKVERRSVTWSAFRLDAAAMTTDDSLDDRKADSASGKFLRAVQTLEWNE
jgi:hypothetical protein